MALTCQQKESLSRSPSRPSANSVFFALPFGRQGSLLILLACLASGITAGQHLGVCVCVCVCERERARIWIMHGQRLCVCALV